MAQAVESTESTVESVANKAEPMSEAVKPSHLHLVDEKTDPNIRVGIRLRNARLGKGLTIEDVAKYLKFRREYLDAIENMQVGLLPKGFVNPYIRDYARHLGLEPAKCVEDFNLQCGALSQASEILPQKPKDPADRTRTFQFGVAIIIAGLMALGAYFAYSLFSKNANSDTQIGNASPVIAVTPNVNGARLPVTHIATPVVNPLTETLKLEVRARERAWIEVRGADGTLFIDRHFAAGETYDVRVGAGWTLTTQNAGAFEWVVEGEVVHPVGEPDQALYTLSIDEVALNLSVPEPG